MDFGVRAKRAEFGPKGCAPPGLTAMGACGSTASSMDISIGGS
jgi:hypothetical protein